MDKFLRSGRISGGWRICLLWFFLCLVSTEISFSQYVYYSKGFTETSLLGSFSIVGNMNNHTLIYEKNPNTGKHVVSYYDLKMNIDKQDNLDVIPANQSVIGVFVLNSNEYMVFHVANQKNKGQQSCYYTRVDTKNFNASKTELLGTINYVGDENIYNIRQSPSGSYCMIYVLGKKDEENAVMLAYLFSTSGKIVQSTGNIFSFQELIGEEFGENILTDEGDFSFSTIQRNRYSKMESIKLYVQYKGAKGLNMNFVELNADSISIYQAKYFYHPKQKTWNLLYYYSNKKNPAFISGYAIKSWTNDEKNKMSQDVYMSFSSILMDIKKQVDPSIIEDSRINSSKINNTTFLELLKLRNTENEENAEEEPEEDTLKNIAFQEHPKEVAVLDEDEEQSINRIQYLMELFSLRSVNIVEVIPENNGGFIVLLENKERNGNESVAQKRGGFLSSIAPFVSVGVGSGMGVGNNFGTGVGVSVPLTSSSGDVVERKEDHKVLNNIIVLSVKKDGTFQWGASINKHQESRIGDNLSFCTIQKKDKIQLFYINDGNPNYIYSISIKPNGEIMLNDAVKGTSAAYGLITWMAKQTNKNATVIPTIHKNGLSFMRLVYD